MGTLQKVRFARLWKKLLLVHGSVGTSELPKVYVLVLKYVFSQISYSEGLVPAIFKDMGLTTF